MITETLITGIILHQPRKCVSSPKKHPQTKRLASLSARYLQQLQPASLTIIILTIMLFGQIPSAMAEDPWGCDPVLDAWTCDEGPITASDKNPSLADKPITANTTEETAAVEQTISQTGLCPTFNRDDAFSAETLQPPPGEVPTLLDGDKAKRDTNQNYTVSGNVILRHADERLHADTVHYNEPEGYAEAEGRLFYDNPDQRVVAKRGRFWLEQQRGELENARFNYYGKRGRGQAEKVYIEGPKLTRYVGLFSRDPAATTRRGTHSTGWR